VVPQIVDAIRAIRPDVVLTFGHDGIYGHPDHIAISQFTTAAVVAAADIEYTDATLYPPHRVAKLYHRVVSPEYGAAYEEAFGELVMEIDGQERRTSGWPAWQINATIDATAHWETVWDAVQRHRSQLPLYDRLVRLSPQRHAYLWGTQEFYRVFSHVNGGRAVERDLFEGLREAVPDERVTKIAVAA
jgi:LmbE family N-acetylglucosaminyl deacetylase